MQWAQQYKQMRSGFTIVELLIVVVVIGILAAITIVSYNGITQRASASVAQGAVDAARKKIALYSIENGTSSYPANLEDLGLVSNDSVTYQYTVNTATDPDGYCVTATANEVAYRLGKNFAYTSGATTDTIDESTAASGACPGHSSTGGATIVNRAPNPSVEISTSGYSGPNGAGFARSTVRAQEGAASVLVTLPANKSYDNVGAMFFQENPFVSLKQNTKYVASAYVWVPIGTALPRLSVQGSGRTVDNIVERTATVREQWTRVWNTFTTNSGGSVTAYLLNAELTDPVVTTQYWADSFMITEGSIPPSYKDGNSDNWVWLGTSGLSQSSGPL